MSVKNVFAVVHTMERCHLVGVVAHCFLSSSNYVWGAQYVTPEETRLRMNVCSRNPTKIFVCAVCMRLS